jgi:predicted MFS family arabinose efflux permease
MRLDAFRASTKATSERSIIFCVGAVQFVNILDFIIVMPLGPDFSKGLGIPLSYIGYVGGSYTAAACVSGLAGAFFLDRFDRRSALAVAMLGLTLGTVAGAFARGLLSLMVARVVAGAFGGPATSIAYSIIADSIPIERRGKAMGAVMGAFSVASVLGVPAGLELAHRGGWRLPFIAVAVLGGLLGTYAYAVLPPMFAHVAGDGRSGPRAGRISELRRLLRPEIGLALTTTMLTMGSGFVLFPNVPAYLLGNLGYPRDRLGLLYFVGGIGSFVSMRVVGRLVDRHGSARVGTAATLLVASVIYVGFLRVPPALPVLALFVFLMLASSSRNVAYNTLQSRVPTPDERARFGSLQSAVQHLAASIAAFAAARMLTELPDQKLAGMSSVAATSIALSLGLVPLYWTVEGWVKRRATQREAAAPTDIR